MYFVLPINIKRTVGILKLCMVEECLVKRTNAFSNKVCGCQCPRLETALGEKPEKLRFDSGPYQNGTCYL